MASAQPRRTPRPHQSPPSTLAIRNVVVAGRRTSVRLEPLMWESLRDIARDRDMALNDLVTEIDRRRDTSSLTAAIRVYIVDFYRNAAGRSEPSRARALPLQAMLPRLETPANPRP